MPSNLWQIEFCLRLSTLDRPTLQCHFFEKVYYHVINNFRKNSPLNLTQKNQNNCHWLLYMSVIWALPAHKLLKILTLMILSLWNHCCHDYLRMWAAINQRNSITVGDCITVCNLLRKQLPYITLTYLHFYCTSVRFAGCIFKQDILSDLSV